MREFSLYQSADNKVYKIIFPRMQDDTTDYHHRYGKYFEIYLKDSYSRIMLYVLSIEEDLLKEIEDGAKDKLLTRIGLLDIFNLLDKGEIKDHKRNIKDKQELGSESSDWFIKYPKFCSYREGEGKEFICTLSGLENKTKIPIDCAKCRVPEDFLRCEHLFPLKDIGKPPNVVAFSARCHLGKSIESDRIMDCLLRTCFKPFVMKSRALKQIQELIPKGTLISQCFTLIDNINTLLEQKFQFELFKIQQLRAISDLCSPCFSDGDFDKKILVLGSLLDWIDVGELKKRLKISPKESGSINLLEQFLGENNFANTQQLILRLRRIKRISTKYPRHIDKPVLITDFQGLGLSYPPSNWSMAWDTIVRDFLVSLSELREILQ